MASTGAGGRGESMSPKRSRNASPPRQDPAPESKVDADSKAEPPSATDAETTKPLAPPPRPAQQPPSGNTPDYFANPPINASLSLEPNPFEQSFGGAPDTPGGTKLPSVAALTSPSSLLPGGGVTPFPWGAGSLRTGPLSPAMLSGPANDYFSSDHIRGSFPTPNESSLRTGLTPGGSGSMFPAPSPNSALFALTGSTAPTPSTLDFHRTAVSAAKREQKSQAQTQQSVTSQPQPLPEISNGVVPLKNDTKPAAGPFDPHDNDAANGLFMLAQGRNGTQPPPQQQYPVIPPPQIHTTTAPAPAAQAMSTSPQMNGNGSIAGSSARGVSEAASARSDDSEIARPNTRAKGKRNSAGGTNSRRKAEDNPGKAPASKKVKMNGGAPSPVNGSFDDMDHSDDDMMRDHEGNGKSKMTDEEKRKNFLERNRVAALKCRQRKKQWLANLQSKVEVFSNENDNLTAQISALREEVVNLKTLLLAHKDCPVTQQQGMHSAFMQQATMEPFNQQMNPYGMGAPMPSQPVPIGTRRFS
ncbi:Aft1 HRA domain-containing protein [Cercophora newfieldiana]|uniref:Aft1 HRA domain-containing protein n=1 Tax=Cercophora newfieldiana TaxID=92897 RepID=A0AA40CIV2_9PEZI|nr:Aft1 HRA domain-containing protein [Cercophora newfieldiana]